MIRLFMAAFIGLFSTLGWADFYEIEVGKSGYNRFTFDVPFEKVVFPRGSPISGAPVTLGENTSILIEIRPEAIDPIQMVAQLVDGSIVTLNLLPRDDAEPAMWRQNKNPLPPESARTPIQRPEDNFIAELFKSLVMGGTPRGFRAITPPTDGRLGPLRSEFIAAFRNAQFIVLVSRLHSDVEALIQPQDLYAPGVKAVMIDGDVVGGLEPPMAYILMEASR